MKLVLIEDPLFQVILSREEDPRIPARDLDILAVASKALFGIKALSLALLKGAWITGTYLPSSFKINVLRRQNFSLNLYALAARTVYWAVSIFCSFCITSVRLFLQQLKTDDLDNRGILSVFAEESIDLHHLKTNSFSIDMSDVPQDVSVADIKTFFQEVNFNDKNHICYMSPQTYQETQEINYSPQNLEEFLNKFVQNVEGRIAFLGTPRSYDIPELFSFYQKIENAVRFSIAKYNRDLEELKEKYGQDPNNYVEEARQNYRTLFENRARLAFDLAIAGAHCGARYMGDAMESYYYAKGTLNTTDYTLEESLYRILEEERLQIAKSQIITTLGTSTHQYALYMAQLGQLLGLPATEGVTEQLESYLDKNTMLRLFFQEYTEKRIITVLQEKCQSEALKEKILNWAKSQMGNWGRTSSRLTEDQTKRLEEIFQSPLPETTSKTSQCLERFCSALTNTSLQQENSWARFVRDLFLKDPGFWNEARAILLSEEALFKPIALEADPTRRKELILTVQEKLQFRQRCAQVQNQLTGAEFPTIPIDVLGRALAQEKEHFLQVIQDWMELALEQEFLTKLPPKNPNGELDLKFLEWVLVSHKILKAQDEWLL